MTRIILIGYMGAGKTTVGKALAHELGLPFYDLDWYIESRRRKTVAQIFAEQGEEGFRKIEYNMLHEVAEFEDVIISCGGGTPCFFDNIDYDVLCKHLAMSHNERPLLKGKTPEQLNDFITEQLALREPFYQRARYHFDVSLLDRSEKITSTIALLRQLLDV